MLEKLWSSNTSLLPDVESQSNTETHRSGITAFAFPHAELRYRLPDLRRTNVGCSVDLHPSPLPAPQPISCH